MYMLCFLKLPARVTPQHLKPNSRLTQVHARLTVDVRCMAIFFLLYYSHETSRELIFK